MGQIDDKIQENGGCAIFTLCFLQPTPAGPFVYSQMIL